MTEHRNSITRTDTRTQSSSGPATQEFVQVAVLPPRLPANVAPPTGVGASEAFSWDESVNWSHNQPIDAENKDDNVSSTKKWMRKSGLTTQRKKANPDTPPFVFRKVPYDTWRKHYAKDANGGYKGTHAPAEDCLLLPEDVSRWRLDDPTTKADLWTRGKDALPVYDEASTGAGAAPAYTETYADTSTGPPAGEPRLDATTGTSALAKPSDSSSTNQDRGRNPSTFTADGKTSEQIIAEAKLKAEAQKQDKKGGWKNTFKRATEYAMMGNG